MKFAMLPGTKKEYESLLRIDWEVLGDSQLEQKLTAKDVIILKLYFAFMGKEYYNSVGKVFIGLCKKFFGVNKANLCMFRLATNP